MPSSPSIPIIAYQSPWIPVEWIAAHGLIPRELRPRGASHRPMLSVTRGICPFAGGTADSAISDLIGLRGSSELLNHEFLPRSRPPVDRPEFNTCAKVNNASALVLATVCDQMRYVATLVERASQRPVFLFNVPSTWQTAESRQFYLDELLRLSDFFVRCGGVRPDDSELARVMFDYDRARRSALALRERLSARRFAEVLALLRGPREGLADIHRTEKWFEESPRVGIPLAVLGGPLLESDLEFFDVLERAGGRVVLDATEGGERMMPRCFHPENTKAQPLQELVESYFILPDAFRRPNTLLYEWFQQETRRRDVRGIVFRRYIGCDLWHAELHRLKNLGSLPVLDLDAGSDDTASPNRMQGRIESFLEMLA